MKKIKFIRPDPVPFISLSWSEGRVFDLWMIVHALSGMILACGIWLLPMPTAFDYPLILVLLILWEIGEMISGIKEEPENLVLDIVSGMVGFWIVYEHIVPEMTHPDIWMLGSVFVLVIAVLNFFGWKAYKKRGQ